jgi:hypothetical protein
MPIKLREPYPGQNQQLHRSGRQQTDKDDGDPRRCEGDGQYRVRPSAKALLEALKKRFRTHVSPLQLEHMPTMKVHEPPSHHTPRAAESVLMHSPLPTMHMRSRAIFLPWTTQRVCGGE